MNKSLTYIIETEQNSRLLNIKFFFCHEGLIVSALKSKMVFSNGELEIGKMRPMCQRKYLLVLHGTSKHNNVHYCRFYLGSGRHETQLILEMISMARVSDPKHLKCCHLHICHQCLLSPLRNLTQAEKLYYLIRCTLVL